MKGAAGCAAAKYNPRTARVEQRHTAHEARFMRAVHVVPCERKVRNGRQKREKERTSQEILHVGRHRAFFAICIAERRKPARPALFELHAGDCVNGYHALRTTVTNPSHGRDARDAFDSCIFDDRTGGDVPRAREGAQPIKTQCCENKPRSSTALQRSRILSRHKLQNSLQNRAIELHSVNWRGNRQATFT